MHRGDRGHYMLVAAALVAAAPAVVVLAFGALVTGVLVGAVRLVSAATRSLAAEKPRAVRGDASSLARWEDDGGSSRPERPGRRPGRRRATGVAPTAG